MKCFIIFVAVFILVGFLLAVPTATRLHCFCPVNSLLSWGALVPLSRLTYGAYLIHSPLYLVRAGILRERFSIQHYHLVMEFFGCLTMAYLLAYLMYLICEAPVARLEKLAFEGSKKKLCEEASSRVDAVRL